MSVLLDVNLLVALAWPNHVHHGPAAAWFLANQKRGWVTCPITESGFVRVSSNSNAIANAVSPRAAISMLERYRGLDHHEFWADDVSIASSPHVDRARLASYTQVTDAQLLALARSRGGNLATFDRRLSRLEAPGATSAIEQVLSIPD